MSIKQILLLLAPEALPTLKRPSATVTTLEPDTQRLPLVGVPLTNSVPSTSSR